MKTCRNCAHNVFDEVWDEYRCTERERRVYGLDKITDCEFYEKRINEEDYRHESLSR